MQKRILSLVLCLVTFITTISVGFVNVSASDVSPTVLIMQNDKKVSSITLPDNEKATVSAKCEDIDEPEFKWQILADMNSDLWVDIQGQNEQSIDLSYPMLSSALDKSGSGYVRCAVTIGEETHYSEPLCVTVSFTPKAVFEPSAPKKSAPKPNNTLGADNSARANSEYVYITVNYIDAVSGNQLFGSHTSKIEIGTVFNEIVHSPTFLGFAPYYYTDNWDKNQSEINKDTSDENNTDIPDNANSKAAQAGTLKFGDAS